jgi:uncharacterized protein (DUF736 family)
MLTIGTFTKVGELFTGTITTLTLKLTVNIIPVERSSENAPDYRVYSSSVECGAAWKRTPADGRETLSVKLDDPAFPNPIFATLSFDDTFEMFMLVWSRAKERRE